MDERNLDIAVMAAYRDSQWASRIVLWSEQDVHGLKVGFHYPSSRAELTARELGCIF